MSVKSKINICGIYFYFFSGVILYFWPNAFRQSGEVVIIVSIAFLMVFISWMRFDFLLQLRLIFFLAVGFAAGVAKLISPDMVLIDLGNNIQTYDVLIAMYSLSMIGGSSIMVGYILARKKYLKVSKTSLITNGVAGDTSIYIFSLLLILAIGYLSARSYGPPIWEAAYSSGKGEGQALGLLQAFGIIFIGINFLTASHFNDKKIWLLSFSVYFYLLFVGILIRGGRLEFLAGILALYYCQKLIHVRPFEVRLRHYLLLGVAALFMEYGVGWLRYSLVLDDPESIFDAITRMYENKTLFLGTISGLSSSFASLVHMIQNNVLEYGYGISYFEYILRTPPEFLYPERPADMSSVFDQYGYTTIGGFSEITEAYYNFGIFGAMIIPGVITYLFKRFLDKAYAGGFLNYVFIISIISVFFRGALYQTFAYYKALIAGVIVYFLIIFWRAFIGINIKK